MPEFDLIRFAVCVGFVSLGISMVMVVVMLGLRLFAPYERRGRRKMGGVWRRVLLRKDRRTADLLTRPHERIIAVLEDWNQTYAETCGHDRRKLYRSAERGAMLEASQQMLGAQSAEEVIVGLTFLGHLGASANWDKVRPWTDVDHPYISLTATFALVRIDRDRARSLVTTLVPQRADWPVSGVAVLLREAGGPVAVDIFESALALEDPDVVLHIFRVLETAEPQTAMFLLHELLERRMSRDLLVAYVYAARRPENQDVLLDKLTAPSTSIAHDISVDHSRG